MMASIKAKDTKPEKRVRKYLHASGLRFRLHVKGLPGSPDIVLPKYCTAIFVHGCYWHRHRDCRFAYTPKSNVEFWTAKFDENVSRDARNQRSLENLGWRVLVIWECETSDSSKLESLVNEISTSYD
jgi:DNA mismatch endonuclease (patch repair protein)